MKSAGLLPAEFWRRSPANDSLEPIGGRRLGSRWRTAALNLVVISAGALVGMLALELWIRAWDFYRSRQAHAAIAHPVEASAVPASNQSSEPSEPSPTPPPPTSSTPGAARAAGEPEPDSGWGWIVPDDDLVYRLPAEHPGFSRRGSQRVLVAQPPSGFRVLILGDSVAHYGNGFGDTLPGRTEENLRRDTSLQPAEFLNSSIVGYTNYQELLWLKKYGLEFNPQLVGVIFVMNDVHKFLHTVEMPGGHGILYLDLYGRVSPADFLDDRIRFNSSGRRRVGAIVADFPKTRKLIPAAPCL